MDKDEKKLLADLAAFDPLAYAKSAWTIAAVDQLFKGMRKLAWRCFTTPNEHRVLPLMRAYGNTHAQWARAVTLDPGNASIGTDVLTELNVFLHDAWDPLMWTAVARRLKTTIEAAAKSYTDPASSAAYTAYVGFTALMQLTAHRGPPLGHLQPPPPNVDVPGVGDMRQVLDGWFGALLIAAVPTVKAFSDLPLRRILDWAATFLHVWDCRPTSRAVAWGIDARPGDGRSDPLTLAQQPRSNPAEEAAYDLRSRLFDFAHHVMYEPLKDMPADRVDLGILCLLLNAPAEHRSTHLVMSTLFVDALLFTIGAKTPEDLYTRQVELMGAPGYRYVRDFFSNTVDPSVDNPRQVLALVIPSVRRTDSGAAVGHFSLLVFFREMVDQGAVGVAHFDSASNGNQGLAQTIVGALAIGTIPGLSATFVDAPPRIITYSTLHTQTGAECGMRTLAILSLVLRFSSNMTRILTQQTAGDMDKVLKTMLEYLKLATGRLFNLRRTREALVDHGYSSRTTLPDSMVREKFDALQTQGLPLNWEERLRLAVSMFNILPVQQSIPLASALIVDPGPFFRYWLTTPGLVLVENDLLAVMLFYIAYTPNGAVFLKDLISGSELLAVFTQSLQHSLSYDFVDAYANRATMAIRSLTVSKDGGAAADIIRGVIINQASIHADLIKLEKTADDAFTAASNREKELAARHDPNGLKALVDSTKKETDPATKKNMERDLAIVRDEAIYRQTIQGLVEQADRALKVLELVREWTAAAPTNAAIPSPVVPLSPGVSPPPPAAGTGPSPSPPTPLPITPAVSPGVSPTPSAPMPSPSLVPTVTPPVPSGPPSIPSPAAGGGGPSPTVTPPVPSGPPSIPSPAAGGGGPTPSATPAAAPMTKKQRQRAAKRKRKQERKEAERKAAKRKREEEAARNATFPRVATMSVPPRYLRAQYEDSAWRRDWGARTERELDRAIFVNNPEREDAYQEQERARLEFVHAAAANRAWRRAYDRLLH